MLSKKVQISPCMPAKWASPSKAAIHNSWESTSAPTRWYPGGTCTMAFSSLPTRSRYKIKVRLKDKGKFKKWYSNIKRLKQLQSVGFAMCHTVSPVGLLPEHCWQWATLAPQPDALLFPQWWPEGGWHHIWPLHQSLCVFRRQRGHFTLHDWWINAK